MTKDFFIPLVQQKLQNISSTETKRHIIREQLQLLLLSVIFQHPQTIYFMWWTNVRICYQLPRFSEDVDFATVSSTANFSFDWLLQHLQTTLSDQWFAIEISSINTNTAVAKCFIKFSLISELLSTAHQEKIRIKLEIDQHPPEHATTKTFPLMFGTQNIIIHQHDLPTTFAGKIGAILLRPYRKGRDYFDLWWYLQNFTLAPNISYLQQVFQQAKKTWPTTQKACFDLLYHHIQHLTSDDMQTIAHDIQRFVDRDQSFLNSFMQNYQENILYLLRSKWQKKQ